MAKVLSAKETTAQWCQIREGGPKAETVQLCQKEESTARECQIRRLGERGDLEEHRHWGGGGAIASAVALP